MTAGMPYSRATMAAWEAKPPVSTTTAAAHWNSGDILVCPYTNPSCTPLFRCAAAVVVDTGGLASHAAIVAREDGFPAVMGTGTATTALRDGQMVTVDGDHGRVIAAGHDGPPPDDRAGG